jgi:hypothetical protein
MNLNEPAHGVAHGAVGVVALAASRVEVDVPVGILSGGVGRVEAATQREVARNSAVDQYIAFK